MGEYFIKGQRRINGEIRPDGAKNAVLPILAAAVLNGGTSIIHNCPDIADTRTALRILQGLGCKTEFQNGDVTVDSNGINCVEVKDDLVKAMRSSIIFMGSLLGRFGEALLSFPGGCNLGERSIGYHISAFRKMGANIDDEKGALYGLTSGLTGQKIILDTPSVGATENIMLASVLARGETVISNAAREPEIASLQDFLNAMGAKVSGAGTDKVIITGVNELHDAEYTVIPDRIIAGTFMTAAAITGGSLTLTGVMPEHIYPIYSRLEMAGCVIKEEEDSIFIRAPKRLISLESLTTMPYPGFPTDMQPQFTAMLCLAKGECTVKETIFEGRNRHVNELRRMGADIIIPNDGKFPRYIVRGTETLTGSVVEAHDLRGGAAMIIAGLASRGETIVKDASCHIQRGYNKIEEDLVKLGADIKFSESKNCSEQ